MKKTAVVHVNVGMPHQVLFGNALVKGLNENGYDARVGDRTGDADVHVVLGPHYAYQNWRMHPRVIYLDRAYWGDPECVSLHWLHNGEKCFTWNIKRPTARHIPELKHWRFRDPLTYNRRIFLRDYNAQPHPWEAHCAAVRVHPNNASGRTDAETEDELRDLLKGYGTAVGGRSTAMLVALQEGMLVDTYDPHSPVYPVRISEKNAGGSSNCTCGRGSLFRSLAWHNWSLEEIQRGDFIHGIGYDFTAAGAARIPG